MMAAATAKMLPFEAALLVYVNILIVG